MLEVLSFQVTITFHLMEMLPVKCWVVDVVDISLKALIRKFAHRDE